MCLRFVRRHHRARLLRVVVPVAASLLIAAAIGTVALGLAERRARNLRSEVLGLATAKLRRRLEAAIEDDPGVVELLNRVVSRELDPASAAAQLLEGEIDE